MLNIRNYNLQAFAGELNLNKTTSAGLTEEMKTYYSDYLIDNAEPHLVHNQFGQKHPIPQGKGKTIQFRKYNPLPKLTNEIQEGITPDGQSITMDVIEATVKQYGGYVSLTDMLLTTAIDNNLVMATKLLGSQAGRTMDTITREVLNGGTNVLYGAGTVSARYLLSAGAAGESGDKLTVDCIRRAVRILKNQNAEKIDGYYVAIIHPDVAYDLMNDPDWQYPHQYVDTKELYEGEIGKIAGVRFVETTEAKIFHADDLAEGQRTMMVATGDANGSFSVQGYMEGDRWIIVGGKRVYYSNAKCYTDATKSSTVDMSFVRSSDVVYPGEAGAEGRDVYSTLILGDNAYGTTEITGGGIEHIVKQLGSAGTSDPLNQRATAGWKATSAAARLVESYMVRIETVSTFESGAN